MLKQKLIKIEKSLINSFINLIKSLFNKFDYLILHKSYFLPIPDENDIKFVAKTDLVGITIDVNESIFLINNVFNKYKSEFNLFPTYQKPDNKDYYLINGSYMAIDGNVYYSLVRHLKPKKIIEIGSGNSTLLANSAILKNIQESGKSSELICIEPYPGEQIKGLKTEFIKIVPKIVQEIELDFFMSLQADDILFIDSTHALKSGGDVWYEYCEILPRLNSGVYVHIHDISLPKPYPKVYFENGTYWNEQYLLQAYLTNNSKVKVIWPGNYLMEKYPEIIKPAFSPEYDLMRQNFPFSEPTSFWFITL
jgi:hypothetical protein